MGVEEYSTPQHRSDMIAFELKDKTTYLSACSFDDIWPDPANVVGVWIDGPCLKIVADVPRVGEPYFDGDMEVTVRQFRGATELRVFQEALNRYMQKETDAHAAWLAAMAEKD